MLNKFESKTLNVTIHFIILNRKERLPSAWRSFYKLNIIIKFMPTYRIVNNFNNLCNHKNAVYYLSINPHSTAWILPLLSRSFHLRQFDVNSLSCSTFLGTLSMALAFPAMRIVCCPHLPGSGAGLAATGPRPRPTTVHSHKTHQQHNSKGGWPGGGGRKAGETLKLMRKFSAWYEKTTR